MASIPPRADFCVEVGKVPFSCARGFACSKECFFPPLTDPNELPSSPFHKIRRHIMARILSFHPNQLQISIVRFVLKEKMYQI